jgi:serine protease Do
MWYKNKLMLLPAAIGIIAIGWGLKSVLVPVNPSTTIGQSNSNTETLTQPLPGSTEPAHVNQTPATSIDANNAIVEKIANQVTVRILTESAYGSGAIVAHQGQTYTVLTCQHVAVESKRGNYKILVSDGKSYPARLKPLKNSQKLDLALLEFDSPVEYQVVALSKSTTLAAGARVYAAGFPNYYLVGKENQEETRKLGRKVFKFTAGTVGLILQNPPLPDGYSLGYTNEVELGMSGGPVLNDKGELVGINGRSKYPLQGIDAFTFADGTKPSIENFEKMEPLSWAVPISTNLW